MIFTFTKHPIIHLLEDYESLFAVKKVIGVFYDDKNNLLAYIKSDESVKSFDMSDFEDDIRGLMAENRPFSWYEEASIPFKVQKSGIFQQNLFQEIDKTVLLLRIPNEKDEDTKDLLFIYLDSDLSHFSLSQKSEVKLSGDMKPVLAQFYFNAVMSIIKNARNNKHLLTHTFNPNTHSIVNSLERLKAKNTQLESQFRNTFETLVKSLFYKYLESYNYTITLTDDAVDKLIKYSGTHPELEEVIEHSVSYIKTLFLENIPKKLDIEDYFINTELLREQNIDTHNDRYAKTITLLDNLNQAVKSVKSKGLKTIGVNVGLEMPGKAISSPAISDALKNHKRKILTLFEKYPNRWTELRTNFKPIQNLSKNEVNRLRMTN